MLLLIAIANSTWYLWGHAGSMASPHPTDGSQLDRAIRVVMAIAVDGRILPLFAFLFGYGMVQFARSRSARGIVPRDIKRMLRRRHVGMLLLGLLHALLLFGGDILGAYAVLGLLLMLLFEARNKTLWIIVWILIGLALVGGVSGMATLASLESSGFDLTGADSGMDFPLADAASGITPYWVAMLVRLGFWLVVSPTLIFTGVIPAAILLAWIAARYRVLEEPERWRPLLTKVAVGGIAFGWLSGIPVAMEHLGRPIFSPGVSMGYLSLNYVGGTAAGLGYAAVIALIAARYRSGSRSPGLAARSLAAVGKRSLTFYLLQSVIFAPLLAAWGLGLGEQINTTGAVLISLGIWALSIALAAILERRGQRGPMEAVLRRFSYLPPEKLTPAGPPFGVPTGPPAHQPNAPHDRSTFGSPASSSPTGPPAGPTTSAPASQPAPPPPAP